MVEKSAYLSWFNPFPIVLLFIFKYICLSPDNTENSVRYRAALVFLVLDTEKSQGVHSISKPNYLFLPSIFMLLFHMLI